MICLRYFYQCMRQNTTYFTGSFSFNAKAEIQILKVIWHSTFPTRLIFYPFYFMPTWPIPLHQVIRKRSKLGPLFTSLILDLFMSFGTTISDVILGWYYDILGWKFIMIFNWEKNLFWTNKKFVYLIFIPK